MKIEDVIKKMQADCDEQVREYGDILASSTSEERFSWICSTKDFLGTYDAGYLAASLAARFVLSKAHPPLDRNCYRKFMGDVMELLPTHSGLMTLEWTKYFNGVDDAIGKEWTEYKHRLV